MSSKPCSIILCADDFAMTEGISEGILSLAENGRLSATSAIVTTTLWPQIASRAVFLRERLALGLHLNLTFGAPLGVMPILAPRGVLPSARNLVLRAVAGRIQRIEIAAEIERQLDRFEAAAGSPPDFVDGHHHVHVLKGVREALIEVLARRYNPGEMLLRDPSDRLLRIVRRRVAVGKALSVAVMAFGFARLATASGFLLNSGFSGYSTFGRIPFAQEFGRFLISPGSRQMVMCHPGFADDTPAIGDSIINRRLEEYRILSARPDIHRLISHPERSCGGIRWVRS
jgi:chitin disaccharide deacetylase